MDDHPIQRYITKLREEKKSIPMEDDQTHSGLMEKQSCKVQIQIASSSLKAKEPLLVAIFSPSKTPWIENLVIPHLRKSL